ncbi:type I DNA topoisomerase [bacterium]|nr:type I DNA topoisomerase [bacterium]MBU1782181.1 type I DNA topoisomerase [bacterium]
MKEVKSLIVVESPTKIKTLHKFLGNLWLLGASKGHIKDLPLKTLGVNIKDNFKPQYVVIKGKKEVISNLKLLASQAKEVLLAPDPDREGEAISWHLFEELSLVNKNIKRISFNEITEKAVLEALSLPRDIDLNLVNAQQARRILDRLVGYKISPLLRKKVGGNLSAGRVQSVTVRLICEREEEILSFKSQEYWSITGEFKSSKDEVFKAKLYKIDGKVFELKNKEEVEEILESIKEKRYKVVLVSEKIQKKNPYPPFITSTLQQEAFRRYNFTASKTMQIAQQLYEGVEIKGEGPVGLITYMRTDSPRIAEEAAEKARSFIKNNFGQEYVPLKIPKYKSKKTAQEAHEAIRPTIIEKTPQLLREQLNKDQFCLYHLIWSKFIASQMEPARYLSIAVDIEGERYLFRASSSIITFDGFLKVYQEEEKEEKEEKEKLPKLAKEEEVRILKLEPKQHFTQPPSRYSEATLIKVLEEKGIGRPSTYVPIIFTISNRGYVQKEGGKFYPTDLGKIVNKLLITNFPKILDINFTSLIEEELDEIESGKSDWIKILQNFWTPFSSSLEEAKINIEDIKSTREVEVEEQCPRCSINLRVKIGRFGKFLACSNYPQCNYTKSLGIGIKCLLEGCDGDVVIKRSKKKKIFYGCSNYPKCNFVSWYEPTLNKCPSCNGVLFKKKIKTKESLFCLKPECKKESKAKSKD